MGNKDIIQELNDLGSSLASIGRENVYSVPEGYFDGLEGQVHRLLWLSSLSKISPYQVPAGYFDGMAERMMQSIRNHPDYQTSEEETASISPLLSSLNKRPVYSVPQGYFENFKVGTREQGRARVISIAYRKGFRYAAAAVVTGIIILTGFMIFNNSNNPRPSDSGGKASLAKFEKEVKKIDDVKSTEKLIDIMDAGLNEKELASNNKGMKTEDVQQLLKDIPTEELKEFSEQSKDIEDVMMAN